ncbi:MULTISPECIES: type II toxin-antitoxin system RelE/ParE family toxin [unclassified Bradyrhizobium]|uniref:type II toxin-antitoxin system RelE/ParE family toxin n=1 Tax=unclassified Bradyrhizobium TaxID=2631580 RepID=UPI001BA971A1|nr:MULTISPECIES: type II toxin-antitoxin system RelE/ParE family toxin [unclassified Bradyrhizobium]MBR1203186.1 type II toxin-antitoxin system RelE/ParE family toxin [Bradyrhizobium sp. AUGA SZCCT0124]MBR1312849.1 type II toxin-antitoxin system RelE/ParE family toxin [Bradyrhizobium sp. AUGA SZCCT0051]MBR1341207.1 type II toxin-antitoxin system RelE/ParE family toxin [Bradyrhizobium sp. AUGA SZCCT0105]MBR1356855.1 type II toxin-antitoxin system RelE/ParE family toxin [Bradyrhizobium sp. AUGA S
MGKVRLSRLAQSDLAEIWFLIASDKGPATADHWIDRIEARCGQLAQFPESGPARPDVADGARMLVISRWLALYEIIPGGVRIMRVIDAARSLGELDLSGE